MRIALFLLAMLLPATGIAGESMIHRVPLVDLLSSPETYDKELIETRGFIEFPYEGTAIYIDVESAKAEEYDNAVWLGIDSPPIATFDEVDEYSCYCTIQGIFHHGPSGPFGLHPSRINSVYFKECDPSRFTEEYMDMYNDRQTIHQ